MQTGQTLLSGVLPIVTTPFSGDGRVDLSSLTRVVEHILSSGAHGLVYPAIASEFQTLSPEERRGAVEHVLATSDQDEDDGGIAKEPRSDLDLGDVFESDIAALLADVAPQPSFVHTNSSGDHAAMILR